MRLASRTEYWLAGRVIYSASGRPFSSMPIDAVLEASRMAVRGSSRSITTWLNEELFWAPGPLGSSEGATGLVSTSVLLLCRLLLPRRCAGLAVGTCQVKRWRAGHPCTLLLCVAAPHARGASPSRRQLFLACNDSGKVDGREAHQHLALMLHVRMSSSGCRSVPLEPLVSSARDARAAPSQSQACASKGFVRRGRTRAAEYPPISAPVLRSRDRRRPPEYDHATGPGTVKVAMKIEE
mmetsp:Transcript_4488/g.12554  ORF Transcript_4488/g.12554 Transcript_4488/m.12554 type:complete len:238 (+) Transcript_4488:586-1299(+)